MSVYSQTERVFIDGILRYKRGAAPDGDFEVRR